MAESIQLGIHCDIGNEERKEGFQRQLGFTTAIIIREGERGINDLD